jgi:3-oxoadipate enol-lactonase
VTAGPVEHRIGTSLGELAVSVSGSGDALVLWPSLLMDRTLWAAQVAALSDRWTTIAIDPPGHGASSALERHFTLAECADCLVEVLDALRVDRAHVVGNSWGAMVGGSFAALHPDRVGRAVLMNGTASAAPRPQRIQYAVLLRLARLLGGIRPPLTRSVVRAFLGPTTRRTRPDVVRKVLGVAQRNDVRSAALAVESVVSRRPDQRELFGRIATPVLVIAGREDATFPLAELEQMAASIPGAELVVVEEAAHLVAAEVPDVVNRLVADFLGRPPGGGPR